MSFAAIAPTIDMSYLDARPDEVWICQIGWARACGYMLCREPSEGVSIALAGVLNHEGGEARVLEEAYARRGYASGTWERKKLSEALDVAKAGACQCLCVYGKDFESTDYIWVS